MRQRSQIQTLKELHHICSLQRTAVEFDIERSNAGLRALERRREDAGKALQVSQDGWRQALSGPSFQLTQSAFWAAEILSRQEAVEATDAEIRDQQMARRKLYEAMRTISARCDAVADLTRSARRRAQRLRDEAMMEESSGRTMAGWGMT